MNTSTMLHQSHQSFAAPSSSRRLAHDCVRAHSVGDTVDFGHQPPPHQRCSSHGRWETRANTEEEYDDVHDFGDDGQEPMDILYEREVQERGHHHHHHYNPQEHHHHRNYRLRRDSEPIVGSTALAIASDAASDDLDLRMSMSADHLVALLQREAGFYSTPLPVRYYPTEFAEEEESASSSSTSTSNRDDGSPSPRGRTTSATIGPWRKRIASWMYDVLDHFQYDRNAASVALTYIDRHVGHVLVENERSRHRRGGDGGRGEAGSGFVEQDGTTAEPPIKRRHFQLIAVTCLYLAIKVHGELMEDDPVTGEAYDVVASLVHEVDGRAFLGAKGGKIDEDDDDEEEDEEEDAARGDRGECCDDDLRAMSRKIADLTRRHRMGRWGSRLGQFGLPLAGSGVERASGNGNHRSASASSTSSSHVPPVPHSSLPFKPRKRGMLSGPLRLNSFVELSRGLFTARDIVETEARVLVSMNYVVNPPTSRRFVGELLRMLALSYAGAAANVHMRAKSSAAAAARTAERTLGLDRREILGAVLGNARQQIEGATAVPALSMGCIPSIVAYGAMLNAVEEEFEKFVSSSSAMETDNDDDSPQLEDYQRHYRRYSRSHFSGASSTRTRQLCDRYLFIEAWKDQFLAAVFHATDGILSPDSHDIFRVRELLLDQARPGLTGGAHCATTTTTTTTASPTEDPKSDPKMKRSPRSPRSVVFPNPRMLRGGSFFRQGSGVSSTSGDTARLLSPYDARGRSPISFRSLSGGVAAATATLPHRMYYKQMSEPITEIAAMLGGKGRESGGGGRFARAPTPDVSVLQSETSMRGNSGNHKVDSWRTSMGEATQPPLFFSA